MRSNDWIEDTGASRRGPTVAAAAGAAALAALLGIVALPSTARADHMPGGGDGGRGGVVCGLLPRWDCPVTFQLELGLGGGQSVAETGLELIGRAFAEVGVLIAVHPGAHFHAGPVVELGVDAGDATFAWHVNPKVRGRWWIGGSNWTLEGSAGATITHVAYLSGAAQGYKAGLALEGAFTYHAHFGLFVAGESLFVDFGVGDGLENRIVGGVRGSLIGMGIFLCAITTSRTYWYY